MGSSAKKKKDKKKDFQKTKLKVGKARPKGTNHTDTSFKSKAVVIKQQSLTTGAPSLSTQFSHHLSLLNSKSESQRKESLSYLTSMIPKNFDNTTSQQPVATILSALYPLFWDGSGRVRDQLLKILRSLDPENVKDHVETLSLYVQAGMTHLAAGVRETSINILAWLIDVAGEELVSCSGGWAKTLKSFFALLGWSTEAPSGPWSSIKVSLGKGGENEKALVKIISTFSTFLQTGLARPSDMREKSSMSTFPLWDTQHHQLPSRSNAFAHLNLFGTPPNAESQAYEDRGDRQRLFQAEFQSAAGAGLSRHKREGGEIGRVAGTAEKILMDCMSDFTDSQTPGN